jgi:hypothetical protein
MNKTSLRQFELLERRLAALRMWRLGHELKTIAGRLGIAVTTVWDDINDARRRVEMMSEITKKDRRLDGWVQQEIIKHEALQEWERSKEEAVEIIEIPDPEDPSKTVVKQIKRTGRLGDPRYLAIAQKAEERQAKIYGTDMNPDQLDPFGDESEDQDGGRTYRAVVQGRGEANAVRGSLLVKVDYSKPVEEEEEPGAERPES